MQNARASNQNMLFGLQGTAHMVKRPSLPSETRSCGEVELIGKHLCVYMDRRAGPLSEISLAKDKPAQAG